jgi:hypothetical protein
MAYKNKISLNPANGAVETVIAEGLVGDRPWAVLECVPSTFGMEHYAVANNAFLSCQVPAKILRVSCADFGVKSYASLFVADWKGLYSELAGMKAPDGREYYPRFGISITGVWTDNPGADGELYAETMLRDENCRHGTLFNQIARDFVEALSPVLLRMAAAGPIAAEGENA